MNWRINLQIIALLAARAAEVCPRCKDALPIVNDLNVWHPFPEAKCEAAYIWQLGGLRGAIETLTKRMGEEGIW